ncbi:unnamed protein product [Staurois parvus]|uniref:H15 domain-containing protein n=1 Tax=Staurois parvus TaxID=386267 RepID=A0ABN9BLU4_9NEOB|nr:unnamed protein product [Staurois parvus]
MTETESAPAAAPPAETAAKKKPAKKAAAGGGAKQGSKKASGPAVSELLLQAVSASKERSGVSLAALKKILSAGGYDVDKKKSRLKIALKALVTKGSLVQVKGHGASGSFKINKKQPEGPAAKSPKKKVTRKTTTATKSPKKVAKSPKKKAASKSSTAAKSPKKPAAKRPAKAAAKKPSRKKAAKSPAKAKPAAKKAAKPKKAAPKKK